MYHNVRAALKRTDDREKADAGRDRVVHECCLEEVGRIQVRHGDAHHPLGVEPRADTAHLVNALVEGWHLCSTPEGAPEVLVHVAVRARRPNVHSVNDDGRVAENRPAAGVDRGDVRGLIMVLNARRREVPQLHADLHVDDACSVLRGYALEQARRHECCGNGCRVESAHDFLPDGSCLIEVRTHHFDVSATGHRPMAWLDGENDGVLEVGERHVCAHRILIDGHADHLGGRHLRRCAFVDGV